MFKNKPVLMFVGQVFFVLSLVVGIASAVNPPQALGYEGFLTTTSGTAQSGTFTVTFRVYDALTAGTLLYSETQSVVVTSGFLSAPIGNGTNTGGAYTSISQLPFDKQYFVSVEVGAPLNTGEMSPRTAIQSTAYSRTTLGLFATSSAPTGNTVGQIYFNTTDNSIYSYNGTTWVIAAGSITNIGTFVGTTTSILSTTTNITSSATTTLTALNTVVNSSTTLINSSSTTITGTTTLTNLVSTNSSITNSTSTNLFSSLLSALTAIITNLTSTNSTSTNATSTNLFATLANFTTSIIGDLTATNATFTNATVTGALVFNGGTTNTGTSSFATTTVSSSTIVNLNTTNVTSTNSTSTNSTSTNLFSTNASVTNSTSTNFFSTLLTALSAIITNLTSTNSTSTNATSTNLFSTLANFTTAAISNLTATNATFTNATVTGALVFNGGTTNTGTSTFATTTISSSTINDLNVANSTTTNAFATTTTSIFASTTNLVAGNSTTTNSTTTNLFANNASISNATTTNLFTTILSALTAVITNLTTTNSTSTNATTTNLFASLANFTNIVWQNATGTNLYVSGTSTFATSSISALGIGTSTNIYGGDLTGGLTLNNSLVLASSTALSTTTLALYNNNGTLYWNGSAIGSSGGLPASTTSLYVGTNGGVSVGTTTSQYGGNLNQGINLGYVTTAGTKVGDVISFYDATSSVATTSNSLYALNGSLYYNGFQLFMGTTSNAVAASYMQSVVATGYAGSSGNFVAFDTISANYGADISLVTGSTIGNADTSRGIFTLNAGKTYKLTSTISTTDGDGTSETFSWQTVSGTTGTNINASTGATALQGGAATVNGNGTAVVIYTPATDVKVGLKQTGNGAASVNAQATIEVIAGNAAVIGQSVDYVNATNNSTTFAANGILSATTISGNIPNSNGVFSLTAGKTYRLTASVRLNDSTNAVSYQWKDLASSTFLGTPGYTVAANAVTASSPQGIAEAYYTPSADTTVQVENLGVGARTIVNAASVITIEQVGTTAFTSNSIFNNGGNITNGSILTLGSLDNGALQIIGSSTLALYVGTSSNIGVGTSTNIYGGLLTSGLTLNNALVLASSTAISTTSLALYNNNGTLYWNGAQIATGTSVSSNGLAGAIQISNGSGGFTSSSTFAYATSTNILTLGGTGSTIRFFSTTTDLTSNNLFIGKSAGSLFSTNTGTNNTGIGASVLSVVTTGSNNTAFGSQALQTNNTGGTNSAFGAGALSVNTSGSSNSAFGFNAMNDNTAGSLNVAVGHSAMSTNLTGSSNTSVGYASLQLNQSATNTVAIGHGAAQGAGAYSNQGGTYVGKGSGASAGTGSDYNTLLGYQAGWDISTGANNLVLGTQQTTGNSITTGSNNILLGQGVRAGLTQTGSDQLNIGNLIFGSGLGNNATVATGGLGIGTSTNIYGGALTAGLTLNNALVLASSTAVSTTTQALYNNAGTLYWNGLAVSTGVSPYTLLDSGVITTASTTADLVLATTTSQQISIGTSSIASVVGSSTAQGFSVGTSTAKLTVEGGITQKLGTTSLTFIAETRGTTPATTLDGASDVYVQGKYAYVANRNRDSLAVIDISKPNNPTFIAETQGPVPGTSLNGAQGVQVSGNYAYVINSVNNSLAVIDISKPSSPTFISETFGPVAGTSLQTPSDIFVRGKYAYVTSNNRSSLSIIDISNPYNLVYIREFRGPVPGTTLSGATSVHVTGNYAYISVGFGNSMVIVDVTDPTNPLYVSAIQGPVPGTSIDYPYEAVVSGKYAYIAAWEGNGLSIVDISNPTSPVFITSFTHPQISSPVALKIAGNYAYLGNLNGSLDVIDISNPYSPVFVGEVYSLTSLSGLNSVFISGKYAYVANNVRDSLAVIDLGGSDLPSANIGSAEIGNLNVTEYLQTAIAYVRNTLNVGGGINSGGPINIMYGTSTSASSTLFSIVQSTSSTTSNNILTVNSYGGMGLGTTTNVYGGVLTQGLTLNNSLVLASSTAISTTTFALYNNNSTLYWNNNEVMMTNASWYGIDAAGSGSTRQWDSVNYLNGRFLATAFNNSFSGVMTSTNGVTWTTGSTPGGAKYRSSAYGNGTYVIVAQDNFPNQVETSPDAVTWTSRSSAADQGWYSAAFGNGLFVAVSSAPATNNIMTSPDGITWTLRTKGDASNLYSVIYAGGQFVAVGATNVFTSPDGITWTTRTPAAAIQWNSVTYGNGLYVAVSSLGTTANQIMTSPDAITWTSRTSPNDSDWIGVTYGKGMFVAVGQAGDAYQRVMVSTDGINWSLRTAASTNTWQGVAYGNGIFAAVSSTGNQRAMYSSGVNNFASTNGNVASGTALSIGSLDSGALSLITSGTVRQYIDSTTGGIGMGTSTNIYGGSLTAGLTLNNALVLASSTAISTTTLALYTNNNSSLFWNNSLIASSTAFSISSLNGSIQAGTTTINGAFNLQAVSTSSPILSIASSSGANVFRINSAGAVSIGTTSNPGFFTVMGTSTSNIAFFGAAGGTGCALTAGGALNCSSDATFKKDIATTTYGLETILSLSPKAFNWNFELDGATKTLGFIAQDVQGVVPELVTTDANGKLALNQTGFIPLLVNAMKEMNGKIFGSSQVQAISIEEITASSTISVDDKLKALGMNAKQVNEMLAQLASSTSATSSTVTTETVTYSTTTNSIWTNASGTACTFNIENGCNISSTTIVMVPATTTTSTTTETFVGKLIARFIEEVKNVFANIGVTKIKTDEICIPTEEGQEPICFNKADAKVLKELIDEKNQNSPQPSPSPEPTPEPAPLPPPEPEPEPTPEPSPTPDPVPEPIIPEPAPTTE